MLGAERGTEIDLSGAVIDALVFAASGDRLTGRMPVSRLERLADLLVENTGWLDCEVRGIVFEGAHAGEPGLWLRVSGSLTMRCQRCLAEVTVDCAIDRQLLLIAATAAEADWPEDELEADEYDAIPAARDMSVLSLVEDEVLLALPIVPRHADCMLPNTVGASDTAEREGQASPFAVLADLKKH